MKPTTAILGAVALTAFTLVLAGSLVYALISKTISSNLAVPQQTQILEPAPANASVPASPQTELVAADRAIQSALQLQPGSSLRQSPELVNYQGRMAYEIWLNTATIYVDAFDGKILASSPVVVSNQQPSADAPSDNVRYDDDDDDDDADHDDHVKDHDNDHDKKDNKHQSDDHADDD